MMLRPWPLCTSDKLNLGDRVLSEVEKSNFIALPGKDDTADSCLKHCVPTQEDLVSCIAIVQWRGC